MNTLSRTSSFFIRCIKPNDEGKPKIFNRRRVLQQIETGGLVETLELMSRGFPCRISYVDLWTRFNSVLPEAIRRSITPRDFTEMVLLYLQLDRDDYRLGLTRAFFRFGGLSVRKYCVSFYELYEFFWQRLEKINEIDDEKEKQVIAEKAVEHWRQKRKRR